MTTSLRKSLSLACLIGFVVALATPLQAARRTTTETPPPTVGTGDKPVVSPM